MAIHKSAKVDSSAKMDCHALPSGKARNDRNKHTSPNDSKICGGAVGALAFLGKVSELGVRAFVIRRNTAALLTQG